MVTPDMSGHEATPWCRGCRRPVDARAVAKSMCPSCGLDPRTGGTPGRINAVRPRAGLDPVTLDRRLTGAVRFAAGLVTLILLWLITEPGLVPGMPFARVSTAVSVVVVLASIPLSYLIVRGASQLLTGR